MHRICFSLDISSDRFQAYYQGTARSVQVIADDGRSIRFPASALRPFLDHRGIHGRFEISFDAENRLQSLNRLD